MRCLLIFLLALPLGGCVLKPGESAHETERLAATGDRFGYTTQGQSPATRPAVPDLPDTPEWRDVLRRAFLANGELEASFHEWAMAVQRIDQAGSWPSSNLSLGFEYMFSDAGMKAFDRTTFSASLMDASALPNKAYQNATVAWRDAQSAGERFRAAKFDLQRRVLQAWADYALQAERVRIQEENRSLLRMVADTAASRVRAGGGQQELIRADVELRIAENDLESARSVLTQQRASLNAMLRRDANAVLVAPATLPAARPLNATDDQLLAAGVWNNPDLTALGFDAEARAAAIRRAELEYMPEINPMAAFTGTMTQSLGAAITLPTQFPKIRAVIAEARADLRRVEAMARQTRADRAGEFAASLLAMRDAERRSVVFENEILPLARQTVDLTRRSYASGAATYLDLIDAQRTLLEVRLTAAEATTVRERMLAELEALAGMDIETLQPSKELQ